MDNREENSRSTEQDRVANPVEETVSTTVEPALSENKRERKKREKAEKKKNAPAQGNSLLGSTLAKVVAFVLMIAAAIVGVLGLYGTCMLADRERIPPVKGCLSMISCCTGRSIRICIGYATGMRMRACRPWKLIAGSGTSG